MMRTSTRPGGLRRRIGATAVAAAMATAVLPATGATAAAYKPASNGTRIIKVARANAYQFDITVASKALGKSVKVRILTPKGWSKTAKRTWPVVYAYHGGNDSYVSWTRSTDIEAYALKYDVMVVMPEGANGSYTDWYNGGSNNNTPGWETFHNKEVMELVERNFRVGTVRAVMGLSSGGQGAMTYAARFPGKFRYAASFSGLLSIREPGIPSLLMYMNMGKDEKGQENDPFRIWGIPIIDDENWKQHDPKEKAEGLKGTKIYFSSALKGGKGLLDTKERKETDVAVTSETQVARTSIAFRDRLTELKIPFTAHLYPVGTHSWPYWQREMHKIWPTMMATLGAKKKA